LPSLISHLSHLATWDIPSSIHTALPQWKKPLISKPLKHLQPPFEPKAEALWEVDQRDGILSLTSPTPSIPKTGLRSPKSVQIRQCCAWKHGNRHSRPAVSSHALPHLRVRGETLQDFGRLSLPWRTSSTLRCVTKRHLSVKFNMRNAFHTIRWPTGRFALHFVWSVSRRGPAGPDVSSTLIVDVIQFRPFVYIQSSEKQIQNTPSKICSLGILIEESAHGTTSPS
jgi:hypothetical protein